MKKNLKVELIQIMEYGIWKNPFPGGNSNFVCPVTFNKGSLRERVDGSLCAPAHQAWKPGGRTDTMRSVPQVVVDEVTEALVGEKDAETRTNMVEMVIVALLKVFILFTFLSDPGPIIVYPCQ